MKLTTWVAKDPFTKALSAARVPVSVNKDITSLLNRTLSTSISAVFSNAKLTFIDNWEKKGLSE